MPPNPQVEVEYLKPANASFNSTYAWLQKRQPLQELRQFLAPLRLPQKLKIQVDQCGADRRPYVPGGPVTICYELINHIQTIAQTFVQADQQDILTGTFVQATLHELAYAIFDQLQVPVWGREDDAADRLTALVMLQFGEGVEETMINGTISFFRVSFQSGKVWTGSAFADVTSPDAQRYYNYLCLAFGKDPITFDWVVEPQKDGDPLLPWSRAGISVIHNADDVDPKTKKPRIVFMQSYSCQREYNQVRAAFDLRIMPHVDPDLLLKVKAQKWFVPGELSK